MGKLARMSRQRLIEQGVDFSKPKPKIPQKLNKRLLKDALWQTEDGITSYCYCINSDKEEEEILRWLESINYCFEGRDLFYFPPENVSKEYLQDIFDDKIWEEEEIRTRPLSGFLWFGFYPSSSTHEKEIGIANQRIMMKKVKRLREIKKEDNDDWRLVTPDEHCLDGTLDNILPKLLRLHGAFANTPEDNPFLAFLKDFLLERGFLRIHSGEDPFNECLAWASELTYLAQD
jgi:hypothetical protein